MSQPTVVLVHGAFADASSYGPVIPQLLEDGIRVVAPAVPNRSLNGDAAAVSSVLARIEGPVVLVGHSYGCAVATVAGSRSPTWRPSSTSPVSCPDEGEALGELQERFAPSDLATALVPTPIPDGVYLTVDVDKFASVFAADVDSATAAVLAVTQRPLSASSVRRTGRGGCLEDQAGLGSRGHSWTTRSTPTFSAIGYRRAGVSAIEVDSSHLVMIAQPTVVVDLIRKAVTSVAD